VGRSKFKLIEVEDTSEVDGGDYALTDSEVQHALDVLREVEPLTKVAGTKQEIKEYLEKAYGNDKRAMMESAKDGSMIEDVLKQGAGLMQIPKSGGVKCFDATGKQINCADSPIAALRRHGEKRRAGA